MDFKLKVGDKVVALHHPSEEGLMGNGTNRPMVGEVIILERPTEQAYPEPGWLVEGDPIWFYLESELLLVEPGDIDAS
jgi:hypothetical protein